MWDSVSGREVLPALQGHQSLVHSVTFSPDGTQILSCSYDRSERVWDAITGLQHCVAASSDHMPNICDHLLTRTIHGVEDGQVVHLPTDRTIFKHPVIIDPYSVASYDKSLAVGTRNGQLHVMHFPPTFFTSPETRPPLIAGRK